MRLDKRLLTKGIVAGVVVLGASFTQAEVIFSENFDDQPDWNSGLIVNDLGGVPAGDIDRIQSTSKGHLLPAHWDWVYQNPTLAPHLGDADKREVITIDAVDSSKARGGTGKCFLQQRVSDSSGSFTSDGQLMKLLDGAGGEGAGYDAVYFEFYIAFDPLWTTTYTGVQNLAKLVRLASWNGEGSPFLAFSGGNEGPLFLWNYSNDSYGIRNVWGLRGGPWGDNYEMTSGQLGTLPRGSMNYTQDTVGRGIGGSTPKIIDKVNNGYISDDLSQTVSHEQIWGPGGTYTKVAFYVKMNSAPGVGDGEIRQWIEDTQIMHVENINWVPSLTQSLTEMPKWTSLAIGGNDFFKNYPTEERRQEWWAIDDIKVSTQIPEYLIGDSKNTTPPKPPLDFFIE